MLQAAPQQLSGRRSPRGFTLVELLIVISIAAFLVATLGVTVANYLENAREQQTVATLRKIEGLIAERIKGLERAYKRPDFTTFVTKLQKKLQEGDVNQGIPVMPGFSREATEMLARKMFARMLFPQTLSEGIPFSSEDINVNNALDTGEDKNGNGSLDYYLTILDRIRADQSVSFNLANHTASLDSRRTESSELLYYALNNMEIFGIPPVATEFRDTEVRDTDDDGLLEFIDGWGRPLRFYRSPTRLIKPYGILGPDGVAGGSGDDDGDGVADNFTEINFVAQSGPSDDLLVHSEWRTFAGLLIAGLPRAPYQSGSGGVLVNYDQLNQDPDDPYGLLLSEFRRLSITNSYIVPQALVATELSPGSAPGWPPSNPIWSFPTFDVYHKPLVVSAGPDGELGILEPFPTEDLDGDGSLGPNEDFNGNGQIDLFGHLAIPQLQTAFAPTAGTPIPTAPQNPPGGHILPAAFDQASDNITNRSRGVRGR